MHDVRKVVENSSWMTFRKKNQRYESEFCLNNAFDRAVLHRLLQSFCLCVCRRCDK